MNWDAIGAIGEVCGAIAVVVTLFYLASQIRQNTNALKSESRQAALVGGHAELFKMVDNPGIILTIASQDSLSKEEQAALSAYYFATVRTREFAWGQYREGAIDEAQWETEVNVIQFIFDSSRTRQWWDGLGRGVFSGDFAEFVDQLLEQHPATDTLWQSHANWAIDQQGTSDDT